MKAKYDGLREAVRSPSKLETLDRVVDVAAIEAAPTPMMGDVAWKPPPSYVAFLRDVGCFSLSWYSNALDAARVVALFDPEQVTEASEIVYMPDGVDEGDGELTTNHLVPFAGEPQGEWAFCFDASAPGPEYPVYYHHQDRPRAKLVATGKWASDSDATPDWQSFTAWLEWLERAVGTAADSEVVGQPYPKRVVKLG